MHSYCLNETYNRFSSRCRIGFVERNLLANCMISSSVPLCDTLVKCFLLQKQDNQSCDLIWWGGVRGGDRDYLLALTICISCKGMSLTCNGVFPSNLPWKRVFTGKYYFIWKQVRIDGCRKFTSTNSISLMYSQEKLTLKQ